MKKSLIISLICWALQPTATLSCGIERWAVKTLADQSSLQIVMTAIPAKISELAAIEPPVRAILDAHETSRLPLELHTYRVQGWLVGFKREDDEDFHIVLEDLEKRTATMVVEMPAPTCVRAQFRHDADVLRSQFEERFGHVTAKFKNVRRHRIKVEFIGPGFFDFVHGQTGVAKNGIELHPVFAWRELFFKADSENNEEVAQASDWDCWQWSRNAAHAKPTFLGLAFYKVGLTRLLGVHCEKES